MERDKLDILTEILVNITTWSLEADSVLAQLASKGHINISNKKRMDFLKQALEQFKELRDKLVEEKSGSKKREKKKEG